MKSYEQRLLDLANRNPRTDPKGSANEHRRAMLSLEDHEEACRECGKLIDISDWFCEACDSKV